MRAIVLTKSGPPEVLQLKEVTKPVPGSKEILVKIHASTVTRGDVLLRKIPRIVLTVVGFFVGFKAKRISGVEFAGEVESTGNEVTLFKKGDNVYGTTTAISSGGNAEYICVPETSKKMVLSIMPDNISYTEAAAMPVGFMTAFHLMKKVKIEKNSKVLIYGASGSVGTYAVQLAKYYGADVTGVCSTANLELIKSLGANNVIDYTKEDFRKSGNTYDVIFDAVGKIKRSGCKQSLKESGVFISVKSPTKEKNEYLEFLKKLAEEEKITAVIDRQYPLEQVPEAHRYVETGRKKGNVVINVIN